MLVVLRVAGPFFGDTHAPCKTDAAIDHEQFAVRAIVHSAEPGPVRLVILNHLCARFAQHAQITRVHLRRSDPVEQHMDRDSGTRSFGQRLRKLLTDCTGPIDKRFEGNGVLCGANAAEHGGKNPVAVDQHFKAVAADNRRPEQQPHRACELGIVAGVKPLDLVLDLLLAASEIGDQQYDDEREYNGKGNQGSRRHAWSSRSKQSFGPPSVRCFSNRSCTRMGSEDVVRQAVSTGVLHTGKAVHEIRTVRVDAMAQADWPLLAPWKQRVQSVRARRMLASDLQQTRAP